MRNRIALIAGGAAAAAAVAYGLLRRRPTIEQSEPPGPAGPDPRAEALREKLAQSRDLVDEREAFEAAETPVDAAEPPPGAAEAEEAVEEHRRAVHARGRATVDEMQGDGD